MANEVTKFDKKSRRQRERIRIALPVRVLGHDSHELEWTEMVRLVDVTPFGARFRLSRPTERGRLLHLTMAMPRQLRVFDHMEDQYRVWSVVRNIRIMNRSDQEAALIEVGVAFIGKNPPKSYAQNRARRYEVAQTKLESGLWSVADASGQLSEVRPDDGDMRKESRQLIPVDVLIEVFEGDKVVKSENTVTENISPGGAAVFTSLDVVPGTFVRMSSDRYQAAVLAVVRGRRVGAEGITRLHLEFVGGEWPL
ncbi:MAG TPA: PilZ domain-containing protein [Pyrinomonadaceae bacterium]